MLSLFFADTRATFCYLQWCLIHPQTTTSSSSSSSSSLTTITTTTTITATTTTTTTMNNNGSIMEVIYAVHLPSSRISYSRNLSLTQLIIGFEFTIQIYSQTGIVGTFNTLAIFQRPIYGILSIPSEVRIHKRKKDPQFSSYICLLSTLDGIYFVELILPCDHNNNNNNIPKFELFNSKLISKKSLPLNNSLLLGDNNNNDDIEIDFELQCDTILPYYTHMEYITYHRHIHHNYNHNTQKDDKNQTNYHLLILGDHLSLGSEVVLLQLDEDKVIKSGLEIIEILYFI